MKTRRAWLLVPLLAVGAISGVVWLPISHSAGVMAAGRDLSTPINEWYLGLTYLFLFWRGRRDRRYTWWALDGIVTGTLIVQGLKLITRLPRPSGGLSGFPSGHTTASFAAAWLVMETMPALAPVWFAVAAGIGWSRIETGEHYPYQVIFGSLLGCAVGYGITHLRDGLLFPRVLGRFGRRRAVEDPDAPETGGRA